MIASTAPKPAAGPAPAAGAMLAGAAAGAGAGSFSAILRDIGLAEAAPGTGAAEAGVLAGGMLFPIAGGNAGTAGGKNLPDPAASAAEDVSTEAAADPAGLSLVFAGMPPLPLPPLPGAGPVTLDRPRAAEPGFAAARQPAAPMAAAVSAASAQPGITPPPPPPAVALAPIEIVAAQSPVQEARQAEAAAPLALGARMVKGEAVPTAAAAALKDQAPVDPAPATFTAAPVGANPLAGGLAAPAQAAAAPAPAISAQAPAPEAPQDFATLVSRLAEAREAASPHLVRTAIAHAEFGRISLQFRHEDNALSVTMANSDPAFAGAVQAAAQASGAGTENDRPAQHQQQGASQQPAQGGAGNGGQNPQPRADQAGHASNREQGKPSRSQDHEARDARQGGDSTRHGGGIYA